MGFYDYKLKKRRGGELDLAQWRGRVVLVVNTATGCGFTPQYEGLEALYEKYQQTRRYTSSAQRGSRLSLTRWQRAK